MSNHAKKRLRIFEAFLGNMVYFLIYQLVALRAEAWEGGASATTDDWIADVVTALGHNLENVHLWSSVAQNISFHNAFEIFNG